MQWDWKYVRTDNMRSESSFQVVFFFFPSDGILWNERELATKARQDLPSMQALFESRDTSFER